MIRDLLNKNMIFVLFLNDSLLIRFIIDTIIRVGLHIVREFFMTWWFFHDLGILLLKILREWYRIYGILFICSVYVVKMMQ
jgi:hypothetical protein